MGKYLTQQEFEDKANAVHGKGTYDYSQSVYVASKQKLSIICPKHGAFMQKPNGHLSGEGCRACADAVAGDPRRLSHEDFLEKARAVHGDLYAYEATTYTSATAKITPTCAIHGEFSIIPGNFLQGHGCTKCGNSLKGSHIKLTKDEFIKRASKAHDGKYDYSLVEYKSGKHGVKIICPHHGEFKQTPHHHAKGNGCRKCAALVISTTLQRPQDEFLRNCREVHGEKYDYSLVEYTGRRQQVEIICQRHGTFKQVAGNHLCGAGCPSCNTAFGGYKATEAGFFYVLKSGDITKVGITNKSANSRAKSVSKSSGEDFSVALSLYFEDGSTPLNLETKIKQQLKTSHKNISARFEGFSECFMNVDYQTLLNHIQEILGTFPESKLN